MLERKIQNIYNSQYHGLSKTKTVQLRLFYQMRFAFPAFNFDVWKRTTTGTTLYMQTASEKFAKDTLSQMRKWG